MTRTLIRSRWVIASDGETHHILEDGEVVYEGNRIVFTGYGYTEPVDEVIEAGERRRRVGFRRYRVTPAPMCMKRNTWQGIASAAWQTLERFTKR